MQEKQMFLEKLSFTDQEMREGIKCPCCDQYVKIYKRKIHSKMSYDLIALYKLTMKGGDNFYHYSQFIHGHIGDFAKLSYWGFIADKQKTLIENHKRTSGHWRITSSGKDFVEGMITAQEYAHVFNRKVLGFSGEAVYISHCLGDKFNYERLMSNEQ